MSPQIIHQWVAEYFAAVSALDVHAWLACFASDAISHDPYGGAPMRGREALHGFFTGVTGLFASVQIAADRVFIAGDRAAVKFTGHGVGKNGRRVTFEGIDVFEFNPDGRIQTLWAYWNPAPMLSELQA